MGLATLRRYHNRHPRMDVDTKVITPADTAEQREEHVTAEQLAEHMKSAAFVKAFNEEMNAELAKDSKELNAELPKDSYESTDNESTDNEPTDNEPTDNE